MFEQIRLRICEFRSARSDQCDEGSRRHEVLGRHSFGDFSVAEDTRNAGSVFEQALPGPRGVKAMDGFHNKVTRLQAKPNICQFRDLKLLKKYESAPYITVICPRIH